MALHLANLFILRYGIIIYRHNHNFTSVADYSWALYPLLKISFVYHRYEVIDTDISKAVVDSVCRQMFYLAEELIVFALCDKNVSHSEKEDLVRALIRADRPQRFIPKKPEFKVHLLKNKPHDVPRLTDFIGERSWLVFDLFDVNVTLMEYPPETGTILTIFGVSINWSMELYA